MLQDAQVAIPLGFLLAFLIGPVFFVLLETAAIKGFRAALAVDLGVIFADIVFILIAYFSTNQILEKIKDDPALFIFGGMLLSTYGVISFIQERKIVKVHLFMHAASRAFHVHDLNNTLWNISKAETAVCFEQNSPAFCH